MRIPVPRARSLIAGTLALAVLAVAPAMSRAAPVPAEGPWDDYHVIIWQSQTPAGDAALPSVGIDAAMVIWSGTDGGRTLPRALAPLRAAGLGWYYENIATDFYSNYHRYTPGKADDARFRELKERYFKNPSDPSNFIREPGLSDPAWLARIRARMTRAVGAARAAGYPPLFYNLADEAGIANNGSFWDFDLAPASIAGMRHWLKGQYGTLAALNREWGTHYESWDAIQPETTSQAVARTDENFAAWSDFKAWMDVAFARAVKTGTDAAHAADPRARTALEGGQIPGWGGYDYSRLPRAVDVMEIYDYAQNVDIAHALAPRTVLLATMFGGGPTVSHRAWDLLLRGERGVILWDPKHGYVGPDGAPGPYAAATGPLFRKLRGGIGALLIGSKRHVDTVAILYSPPSFRTQWMLDVKPTGAAWSRRTVDSEYEDDPVRRARRFYFEGLTRLGITPDFVAPEGLAGGALAKRHVKLLVLPHAIALSDGEAKAIRAFVASGGTVVADVVPGSFDAHGKRRPRPVLADLFAGGKAKLLPVTDDQGALAPILAQAGVAPAVPLHGRDGTRPADVAATTFRNGAVTVIGLLRAHPKGVQPADEAMTLALPAGSVVTDLMAGKPLGQRDKLELALGTEEPAIYAVSPRPLARLALTVEMSNGGATVRARRDGVVAALRPLHVAVTGPDGQAKPVLSGNMKLRGPDATWRIAPGPDAPAGSWLARVTDVLTGTVTELAFSLRR